MAKRETEVFRCDVCKKEFIPKSQEDVIYWDKNYGKTCKMPVGTDPSDMIFNLNDINKIAYTIAEVNVKPLDFSNGIFMIENNTKEHHVCADCFKEMKEDYSELMDQAQEFNEKYFN